MAKFSAPLLALFALASVNVAVGSTAFSSDVALAPSSSSIDGPEPHIPVIRSTVTLTTFVSAAPESEIPITVLTTTVSAASESEIEVTTTVSTTTTVTTAVTSTVFGVKPSASVETSVEGHMTVQTSIPSANATSSTVLSVPGNDTFTLSGTAVPSVGTSTIVVTHTANKSSIARTGAPKPTASASAPPEIINAAAGIEFGFAALAVAVAAAVFAT